MRNGKVATDQRAAAPAPLIRAAQYVRMSTENQKYSTANQSEANHLYAATRGMEIVRTYADEGVSGLTFDKREALKRLIEDVQSRKADFRAILVYDVSRWGRFQDPDESGYYEYACKRAGIAVHYCAEQFENDGTAFAAIVKAIKRTMAGEYSRELSIKVFAAQSRAVSQGYRLGGQPGYGLRRMVITESGVRRIELARGEWKATGRDRVILIHGPKKELETIRWIYSTFVRERKTEFQIACILNQQGSTTDLGRPWDRHAVKRILKGEKYIGNNVWNQTSIKLQGKWVRNAPDRWVRAEGVFEPIVDKLLFEAAQAIYRDRVSNPIPLGRPRRFSDEEMLRRLRQLLKRYGYLSKGLLDRTKGIQSAAAYEVRFGSLTQTYKLVGYTQKKRKRKKIRPHRSPRLSDDELLEKLRELLRRRGKLTRLIIEESSSVPSITVYVSRFGGLRRVYGLIGYRSDPYRHLSPRPHCLSREELLDALRRLLRERGRLSQSLIVNDKTMPSPSVYQSRFGGLLNAYELIGYAPRHRGGHPPR